MISVLILFFCDDSVPVSPEGAARGLAALVPLAVEGAVADVALAGPSQPPDRHEVLAALADHAGCRLVLQASRREALSRGLSVLRQDLALVLRAGIAPRPGFAADLGDLALAVASGSRRAAVLRPIREGLARLAPLPPTPVGLLGRRADMIEAGGESLADLARRLRPDARFADPAGRWA